MPTRFDCVLTCLVFTAVCGQARSADEQVIQPTALIRLKSIDGLVEDLRFLARRTDQAAVVERVEMQLKQWLPDGVEGVDTKKPIILYAGFDPGSQEPLGVLLVPITDEARFIKLVEKVGRVKVAKSGELYSCKLAGFPLTLQMRMKDGYASISQSKTGLQDGKLLTPGSLLDSVAAPMVRLQARFDRLPNYLKRLILSQMEPLLKEQEARKDPDESATARALRLAVAKSVVELVTTLFQDGEELSLELDLDKQREKTRFQLGLKARANTPLAGFISTMGNTDSVFGSWIASPNPVWQLAFRSKLPGRAKEILDLLIQDNFNPADERVPGWDKNLYEALKPTIAAGELEVAARFGEPTSKGFHTALVGIKIVDAEKIEKLIKDLSKERNTRYKIGIAKAGSYDIHGVERGGEVKAAAVNLVGDDKTYVAFRKDAVIAAFGESALADLSKALQAKPKPAKALQGEVNVALVSKGYAKGSPAFQAKLKRTFPNPGNDHAALTLEGGNALQLNVEVAVPLFAMLVEINKE